MAQWYAVEAKVISQKGHCEAGHKTGDKYTIGNLTPPGMCVWAFYTLFPFVSALQAGGIFPWEKDSESCTAVCPDPTNPITFELKRLK